MPVLFRKSLFLGSLILFLAFNAYGYVTPGQESQRIVVIKADDLGVPNAKWDRFIEIVEAQTCRFQSGLLLVRFLNKSRGLGVYVALGMCGTRLQGVGEGALKLSCKYDEMS